MFLVGTKHNGLSHGVGTLQVVAHLVSHLAYSVLNHNIIIVIGIIVDAILNQIPVYITLTFGRSPFIADIGGDIDNLEGGQEAIVDTFFQTVRIQWFAKIGDIGLVAGFLRCGSHTKLDGIFEVLQYFAPVTIILGTTTMALINYHHIKELGFKQLFVVFVTLLAYQLLIKGKIHLVGCIRILLILLVAHFMDGAVEWLKVLFDRLINKHIAVGQIEHFLNQPSFQQAINYLECRIGFTRTSSHHQQHTFLSTSHRINGTVNGIALIVARRIDILTCAVRLIDNLQFVGSNAPTPVTLVHKAGIEFVFGRELVHRQRAFLTRQEVVLLKSEAI